MKRKSKRGRSQKRRAGKGENPVVTAFAANFGAWRRIKGVKLREMAAALDVSVSIVSEWEHGHRFPNADHLHAIGEYTGIPAWQFLRP
jgi:transcriptional regulator with XRE-family HTH domain